MSNLGLYRHHHPVARCISCKSPATDACGRCRAPSCEADVGVCGHGPRPSRLAAASRLANRPLLKALLPILPLALVLAAIIGLAGLALWVPYKLLTTFDPLPSRPKFPRLLVPCDGNCDPSGMERRAGERA
ncbi:MAG: hypothetical protein KJO07_00725 [Deltaproteobacteria bacterium]|nr:hypothetical protein [Deltaproteobacteria bacterium]